MSKLLYVKDWGRFQHYKDRNPPWIKLATDLFRNYEFSQMSDASKLLAICIWTLASRTKDGSFPFDLEYIKSSGVLRICTIENIQELVKQGFIVDADGVLADCKQSAIPETETEAYREEVEKRSVVLPHGTFRKIYEFGINLFPQLAPKNTSEITKWVVASCDPEQDIFPALRAAQNKNIQSWNYFSGAVMDAKANRLKPLPKGNENGTHRIASETGISKTQRSAEAIARGIAKAAGNDSAGRASLQQPAGPEEPR